MSCISCGTVGPDHLFPEEMMHLLCPKDICLLCPLVTLSAHDEGRADESQPELMLSKRAVCVYVQEL